MLFTPHRRRSPARRPAPRPRHRTPDPPRRSRTPSRNAIVLTPAPRGYDPTFVTTPDADDTCGALGTTGNLQLADRAPHLASTNRGIYSTDGISLLQDC